MMNIMYWKIWDVGGAIKALQAVTKE